MTRLACSLTGAKGRIQLTPDSRLHTIYGRTEIAENYNCNFGLNPRYESILGDGKLTVVGRDDHGDVRAVELAGNAFFIATLFQPEHSAFAGNAHPLICAFVRAAMNLK